MGHNRLYSKQRSNEVDVQHTLKFSDGHLVDRSDRANTRIIQQDVDSAVLLQRPSDRRCPAFRRSHVKVDAIMVKYVAGNDVSTFCSKELCLGKTLAPCRSGDDHNLAFKPTSHLPPTPCVPVTLLRRNLRLQRRRPMRPENFNRVVGGI